MSFRVRKRIYYLKIRIGSTFTVKFRWCNIFCIDKTQLKISVLHRTSLLSDILNGRFEFLGLTKTAVHVRIWTTVNFSKDTVKINNYLTILHKYIPSEVLLYWKGYFAIFIIIILFFFRGTQSEDSFSADDQFTGT